MTDPADEPRHYAEHDDLDSEGLDIFVPPPPTPPDYAQTVQHYVEQQAEAAQTADAAQIADAAQTPDPPEPQQYPIPPRAAEQYAPPEQQYYAPPQCPVPPQYAAPEQYPAPEQYAAPEQYPVPPQYVVPQQQQHALPEPPYGQFQAPLPAVPVPAVTQQYAPPAVPQAPPPMPAPEDLLVPTESRLDTEPASWGWRGRVNRASGGLIKTKAAQAELDARDAIKRIQRSFSRPMTVVVVQPKGGAGKTPTTVCLSAAFGAHRGGYVVGWDDNETRGTLAVRVENPDAQQSTVWDLLSDLSAFERYDARVGDLSYYVRSQPDAHFDALVSDDNPANMAQIDEEAFQRLHTVLQRFYRLIVVDTGNNVRSPNWQAAVNAADQIVAVSTYQRDVGYSASWVLDHLAQTGREDLARNAVTVLTAADPTPDKEVRAQLVSHFSARTRAVVEIPYDVELAHGGPIRWSQLAPATRNAWVRAGSTVVDALSEHDLRALAARRT